MLGDVEPVVFVATTDADAARGFYEDILGLEVIEDNGFAIVFRTGSTVLRLTRVEELEPVQRTVVGWAVPDIEAKLEELRARGVEPLRFPHMDQDDRGIWHTPDGGKVAWFADPDGNTLAVSERG